MNILGVYPSGVLTSTASPLLISSFWRMIIVLVNSPLVFFCVFRSVKLPRLQRDRTRDLRDTGTMLYQLSCEAIHWERSQFEALIFVRLLLSNCLNWKFTAMIILHFDLQPQFKYMNYFIYTSHHLRFLSLHFGNFVVVNFRRYFWVLHLMCCNNYLRAIYIWSIKEMPPSYMTGVFFLVLS